MILKERVDLTIAFGDLKNTHQLGELHKGIPNFSGAAVVAYIQNFIVRFRFFEFLLGKTAQWAYIYFI